MKKENMTNGVLGIYVALTPKQRRVVSRALSGLLTARAYLSNPDFEVLKAWPRRPNLTVRGKTLFLSDRGVELADTIIDTVASVGIASTEITRSELATLVFEEFASWSEREAEPDCGDFLEALEQRVKTLISDYYFLVKVEGLELKDVDILDLGHVRLARPAAAILEHVKFGQYLKREDVLKQLQGKLWLIGEAGGTPRIAEERFEHRALMANGILGIYAAILYKGAIFRSRIRAVTNPLEFRDTVVSLRWGKEDKKPRLSRRWGPEQNVIIDEHTVAYLKENCYLDLLSAIVARSKPTELETCITRSVFWFAEAYRDRTRVMQFVKLWSCAESFFAVSAEGISELNAKGLATMLTFGGYQLSSPLEYGQLKRQIKRLYDLRSKALHRAVFQHVTWKDLEDFSHWIAWLILSVVSLVDRGYTTLAELHEQTHRLDAVTARGAKRARAGAAQPS